MEASYEMPSPERFTAGTVGEPGHRAFFLQAVADGELVSLKVEKQQVGALAEHLAGILADLPVPGDEEITATDVGFVEPPAASWVVGRMGVAWDERADRMVLLCEQLLAEEEPGARRRPRVGSLPAHPRPGRRVRRARPRARRRRPSALLPVWRAHGRRRPRLPALELSERLTVSEPKPALQIEVPEPPADPAAVSSLLSCGDIEVKGRMPWSSNATFLVEVCGAGPASARHLQAGTGRAAAVGLPSRAVAAGGGGAPPGRRPRLGLRAGDRPPIRRAARRRIAPAVRQLRPRRPLLHALRGRGDPRPAPPLRRVRPAGQQHRPQERALPARRRAAGSGASTTGWRSTTRSSCAR